MEQKDFTPMKSERLFFVSSDYNEVRNSVRNNYPLDGNSSSSLENGRYNSENIYVCPVEHCKSVYHSKEEYDMHKSSHRPKRIYRCEFPGCSCKFTKLCLMNIHHRTHKGFRPYKCDICYKTFLENSFLKTHMRNHTGDLPYKCRYCGKTFQLKSDLKVHQRLVHTEVSKYSCPFCPSSYEKKCVLKSHLKIHQGVRPYSCPYPGCKKTFIEKGNMKSHFRTHDDFMLYLDKVESKNLQTLKLTENLVEKTNLLCSENIQENIQNNNELNLNELMTSNYLNEQNKVFFLKNDQQELEFQQKVYNILNKQNNTDVYNSYINSDYINILSLPNSQTQYLDNPLLIDHHNTGTFNMKRDQVLNSSTNCQNFSTILDSAAQLGGFPMNSISPQLHENFINLNNSKFIMNNTNIQDQNPSMNNNYQNVSEFVELIQKVFNCFSMCSDQTLLLTNNLNEICNALGTCFSTMEDDLKLSNIQAFNNKITNLSQGLKDMTCLEFGKEIDNLNTFVKMQNFSEKSENCLLPTGLSNEQGNIQTSQKKDIEMSQINSNESESISASNYSKKGMPKKSFAKKKKRAGKQIFKLDKHQRTDKQNKVRVNTQFKKASV